MKYQGVDVDHPKIVEYIKNMVKKGEKRETIVRVGVPHEVVESVERQVKKK